MKLLSYLLALLTGIAFLQPFHTEKLFRFKSETSEGVAARLYFNGQPVDTVSMDRLQTNAGSAVYIEFVRYAHEPPYAGWDAVYGGEGNYRVFHDGRIIPESELPRINEFSSPRLAGNKIVYWGFIEDKVFGFRTNLDSMTSDSVLLFEEVIPTDFRYTYDFPIPKDSLFLFRTLAAKSDSVFVDFEELSKIRLN